MSDTPHQWDETAPSREYVNTLKDEITRLRAALAEARSERDEAIRVYTAVAQQTARLMTVIGNICADALKEKP